VTPLDISPKEFLQLYENEIKDSQCIIDVRELMEWDYYHLEKSALLPMNTIPGYLNKLPRDKTLYIICAHGIRSHAVCEYLRKNGFDNVCNVSGGMAAVAQLRGFQYD
jgi:rhodanese-related sulfurtransferase